MRNARINITVYSCTHVCFYIYLMDCMWCTVSVLNDGCGARVHRTSIKHTLGHTHLTRIHHFNLVSVVCCLLSVVYCLLHNKYRVNLSIFPQHILFMLLVTFCGTESKFKQLLLLKNSFHSFHFSPKLFVVFQVICRQVQCAYTIVLPLQP